MGRAAVYTRVMNNRTLGVSVFLVAGATALGVLPGCGATPPEQTSQGDEINVTPANFDEAKISLARIADLERSNPEDPRVLAALQAIQPSLDALNHLVARVEPKTGHVVSFYESAPGVIGVSESAPVHSERILTDVEVTSFVALYRQLSGNGEPPAALVQAEARGRTARMSTPLGNAALGGLVEASAAGQSPPPAAAGALGGQEHVGTTSEALTAGDGAYYVQNCYEGGDAHGCFPDWWNGGWADARTKTSWINVAAITGTVYMQGTYEGTIVNIDPVLKGQWLYWYRESGTYKTDAYTWYDWYVTEQRWDILYATGQEFDWSYEFRWSCDYRGYNCSACWVSL
jgi:hypothetical protein